MTARPLLRLAACGCLLGAPAGCRSLREAGAPEAASATAPKSTPVPAPAEARAAPKISADRTIIHATAQTADGTVWGIGVRDGNALFRWEGDAWAMVETLDIRPGNILAFAADPSRPGTTISIWNQLPEARGRHGLQAWRHEPGQPSVRISSMPNPTSFPNDRRPQLAVDGAGDVWLTFAAALVVRIPRGGEPEVIEIPRGDFTAPANIKTRRYRPIVFTPEAPGAGWLWTLAGESPPKYDSELTVPLRVADGKVQAAPLVAGLPTARVTLVARARGGQSVWALENRGLWDIDSVAGTATPRPSPPGAWRVLDWHEFDDGVEAALVVSGKHEPDHLVGDIWIRRGGEWIDAGPSGDTFVGDWSRSWLISDQAVLGAGFPAGLVAVDLAGDDAIPRRARNLGWEEYLPVGKPRALYRLSDGRLLVQGDGTAVAAMGALRRGWEAADKNEKPPATFTFAESPFRTPDGRLWVFQAAGRGAPVLRHWDGGRWHDWPLPAEQPRWSQEGLWVDARGRAAVLSPRLEDPACERDESAPDGWRRWPSGKALIAARAEEIEKVAALTPMREPFYWRHPILSADGRVLVASYGLWYFADGRWTHFPLNTLQHPATRYGFEEDGTPWCVVGRRKHRLQPDRTWAEVGTFPNTPPRHVVSVVWPDWLKAGLGKGEIEWAQQDSEEVWWVLQGRELWKGCEGHVVSMFADTEPSPFRTGAGTTNFNVHVDQRGHRLFAGAEGQPYILLPTLPGPEVKVEWRETASPADRVAQVTAEGLAHFDWRLDGGPWQRTPERTIWLRELPVGVHTLELRGYSRRLEPGPVARVELRLDYDAPAHLAALVKALASPQTRLEAEQRLTLRGAEAQQALQEALARLAIKGPELTVAWDEVEAAPDRVAHLRGEDLAHIEWRLDGGPWRKSTGTTLRLSELSIGAHMLELRGYNQRLEVGPVARMALRLDYNAAVRTGALMKALASPNDEERRDAVQRLARRGAEAEQAVRAALIPETDEDRRWWLRAALQAIEDAAARERSTPGAPSL